MNEQRQQAYLNLIQQLLDCPNGEEGEILAANQDLIDAEFLQVVEAVAEMMSEEGNQDNANRLRSLGNQLAEDLNQSSSQAQIEELSEEDLQAYFQILMEILLAISDSKGNAEVVYPLFTANTDKLDHILAEILRYWAINQFEEAEANTTDATDIAEYIAAVIFKFGNLIQQFPLGNKASNMEIAIASYETVLQVFTREAFPQDWAMTQNNLATAYGERIKGDKASNIEKAIDSYSAALQITTREAFPQDWAMMQNNLATAYGERIKGDKASNIENAIDSYNAALQITTREAFPQQWAMTQNNLATAYWERIKGDKASNIENAIDSYNAALQITTREAFPQQWATTQNNLGNAYRERIKGDKASNIEKAIDSFNATLQIRTRQAFPQQWAMTQNNLGNAYRERIKGDKASNIEKAIDSFNAALQITTREAFPQDWATTQNNLGNAYRERIKGDKASNIEKAIDSCNAALQITTREAFPQYWAMTQSNLGNAYGERIKGDKASNIENAIDSYNAALQIRTRKAFPQNNAETLFNLGKLYQNEGKFNSAYTTYESAIATVELLRGEIISGEESKRKQAEEWNKLYRNMAEVCLQLQEKTLALEFIERSKTRNLVELLFNDELYPRGEIPPEVTQQLQQLRNEIAEEKQRLQQAEQNNLDINRSKLHQLRQQREDLISKIIGFKPIRFPEIQNLLNQNTAIIEWYIFNDCFRAFIITRDCDKPIVWNSSQEDFQKLEDWSYDEYLQPYYEDKNRWTYELNQKLLQLAEILHLDEIISLIPQNCKKLILIPHRYLHLLPIHALQLSDGEYLSDKFSDGVSYAPSCQLFKITQQQLSKYKNATNLFAIQNPTNDLEFTDIEVETIAAKFKPRHILKHHQATETRLKQQPNINHLKNANWLHFSCHGYFNFNNPAKSGLLLADTLDFPIPENTKSSHLLKTSDGEAIDLDNCLTLTDIFDLTITNCRLVTLSACESGFTDFSNTSDEYIGLPSGFIHAGAASIVSSLWAVDDFSTAILMIKFYENIQNSNNNISIALNQAQKWLRTVTQKELLIWIDDNQNMTVENKTKIKKRLTQNYKPQEQPFEQPCFWAAFYAVGD